MHYLLYFAVMTPLLLGWLFYEAATLPPPGPLFAPGTQQAAMAPDQSAEANDPKALTRSASSRTN